MTTALELWDKLRQINPQWIPSEQVFSFVVTPNERATILNALRAVLPEALPIDGAPKDGTTILAFVPSFYQGKGGWAVVLWHKTAWHTATGAWACKPSHWMPLPAAPVSPQQEKK